VDTSTPLDESSFTTFPVALVCPSCGCTVVRSHRCTESGPLRAADYAGIPRFLFGQKYWGETSSDKMRQLLEGARHSDWRVILRRDLGNEPVSEHLLAPIRADFLHAMPWTSIRNVLDVGAGMGFMSCDMAPYADSVVALEAVPERAEFIKLRARQDGLRVFPIIASAMEMPFAPESFDLITLNGVFEYIGLWGDGDPRALQEAFLGRVMQLLRPGGYLYVGIETRFSLGMLLGDRDHSGLSFTSVMPRFIADGYCRFRARPFYGAEHTARGYRTYTYTPNQYGRMFRRAGFDRVVVHGVYDGYNRQKAVFDINDYRGRNVVLNRIDPPASLAGRLRRTVQNCKLTYRLLEREVVIFSRKKPLVENATQMLWSEISAPGRTVVQLNQGFKILGVICDGGVPTEVLEVEKKGEKQAGLRLERSFAVLQQLQNALEATPSVVQMRWPLPMGKAVVAGRTYRRYEYVNGKSLSTFLLPTQYAERRVFDLVSRALAAYRELSGYMDRHCERAAADQMWADFTRQLASTEMSEDIRGDVIAAIEAAKVKDWKLSAVHGDFTGNNLIVTPQNEFVLIDWEHFASSFPIGTDLIRFHQDTFADSNRLPARLRVRFRQHLQRSVREALTDSGYASEDFRSLQALYIGQQILALGGEHRAYAPLIKAYKERTLALDNLDD
jgi:SAM-dependent methyltransferase/aminoglycoside phosphotransferase (APT) family kinase protein